LIDQDRLAYQLRAFQPPASDLRGALGSFLVPFGGASLAQGFERLVEDIMHQRGLPRTGDARDRHQHPQRDADLQVLEVVQARAADLENTLRIALAARAKAAGPELAAQIAPGKRAGPVGHQRGAGAFKDDPSAALARAGPQIHDVVGGADDVGVVLDHHNGVAQLAQFLQNPDQPARVAAVQPDRGFIQYVAGAHQP
jgi:hypothetical protein